MAGPPEAPDPEASPREPMLSPDTAIGMGEFFQVFSSPSRLLILAALYEGPISSGEIAEITDLSPSNVSHQLRELRASNLVASRRQGKKRYHIIASPLVTTVLRTVQKAIEQGKWHQGYDPNFMVEQGFVPEDWFD